MPIASVRRVFSPTLAALLLFGGLAAFSGCGNAEVTPANNPKAFDTTAQEKGAKAQEEFMAKEAAQKRK
jgi:hypothetical protein